MKMGLKSGWSLAVLLAIGSMLTATQVRAAYEEPINEAKERKLFVQSRSVKLTTAPADIQGAEYKGSVDCVVTKPEITISPLDECSQQLKMGAVELGGNTLLVVSKTSTECEEPSKLGKCVKMTARAYKRASGAAMVSPPNSKGIASRRTVVRKSVSSLNPRVKYTGKNKRNPSSEEMESSVTDQELSSLEEFKSETPSN